MELKLERAILERYPNLNKSQLAEISQDIFEYWLDTSLTDALTATNEKALYGDIK